MSLKTASSKMGKMKYDFNPVLQNRFVLYLFFIIAVVNIMYLLNTKDTTSLVVFVIVGFLTSFFSKNMIVILCITMAVTNVIKLGVSNMRVSEGFEGEDKDNEKKEDKKEEKKEEKKEDEDSKDEKKTEIMDELKKDYPEFKEVQKEIVDGIQKMSPLLNKAEQFIGKFNDYKEGMAKRGPK